MSYVSKAFEEIYIEGMGYKKCGIDLLKLQPKYRFVKDLFDTRNTLKQDNLMTAIDSINSKMGNNTIQMAVSKGKGNWIAKKDLKSSCYTTRWEELPLVN